jgi:mono/diheme cytochrome c family protein
MTNLFPTVLAASTVKSFGAVIAVITVIGFVWYVAVNVRAGRPELSSEVELAPNRLEPISDEVMEGRRLNRALQTAGILLLVSAVGLPLYWLNEPSRQEGAVKMYEDTFIARGARLFAPTADGGYNCAGCHGDGGVGGVAPRFTLNDASGKYKAGVLWNAPALNTVLLRFSEDEVRDILTYGRPGTPMPAWGVPGGGPMTTQQIDELVEYLKSIQIPYTEARTQVEEGLRKQLNLPKGAKIDYTDPKVGQALFNLGLPSGADLTGGLASGAYSCARCHTKGASINPATAEPAGVDLSDYVGFPDGSGALGPSLRYPIVPRQFLKLSDLVDFIRKGSVANLLYGQRGQGSGRMPGFGDNPNTLDDQVDGMYSEDMLDAVAVYESNLHNDGQANDLPGNEVDANHTFAEATTTSTSSTTSTTEKG